MATGSVLITGAAKGIGRATVAHLSALGFQVFAGVRAEKDGKELISAIGSKVTPVILDVTDAKQIAAAAKEIAAAVGEAGLGGLVNNAGMAASAPLELIPIDAFRQQMEVNLIGQLAVTQAMLPLIRTAKGRIINISSVGGRVAGPMLGPYHASKFALEALTDTMRIELKPWGIEVIAVEPGSIATPIWDTSIATADKMVTPEMTTLYGPQMERARAFAVEAAKRGLPPERVAEAVGHALTATTPKTRYIVGMDAAIAIRVISRLPDRMRDNLMARRR